MTIGMRGPTGANVGQNMAGNSALGPYSGQKLAGGFRQGQVTNFSPEQMKLFQSLFSHVGPGSYTSRLAGGDESLFEEMEAPQMRQFQGLLGQLGSRFSQPAEGALSARRSSGFQQAGSAATQQFAESLQSRRQELQRQAIADLMGMSRDLLHEQPYENYKYGPEKKQQSFLEKLFQGLPGLAGAGIGGLFGGLPGAQLGGQIGGSFGKLFQ